MKPTQFIKISHRCRDADGHRIGAGAQTPPGVSINLSAKGLPAGEHAFHIHAIGKCEPLSPPRMGISIQRARSTA